MTRPDNVLWIGGRSGLGVDRSASMLDDVAALPDKPAVVAEGTTITPSMVPASGLAVWLMAAPTVRSDRGRQRGWGAAGGEVDLILERDLLAEVQRTGATVIDTSESADPAETVARLEAFAADWLATRPAARSRAERRRLIRDGNAAIVAQYRGGMARAGNTEGGRLVRSYDCECGAADCAALVERTLDSLPDPFTSSAAPILATGHQP